MSGPLPASEADDSERDATAWTVVLVAAVAAAAAVGTAIATRVGPTITPDGVSYLRMADGLALLEHPPGHFPNGYPVALSILQSVGLGQVGAGRWLGVLLSATNVMLAGTYTMRLAGGRWAVGVALAVAAATPLAVLNAGLYSEPMFLSLMLAWLLCIRSEKPSMSAAAGTLAAAAFLTRYAGAALILAGVGILWPQRRRLLPYAAGAAVPLVLWSTARASAGSLTSRAAVWHPPSRSVVFAGAESVGTWATGVQGTLFGGSIVVAGAVLVLVRARHLPSGRNLGIAAACYVVIVALTIAVFDAQTPLDSRLLAPVQLLVILACPAVGTLPLRRVLSVGLAVIVVITGIATADQLSSLRSQPLRLDASPTIAAARGLDGPMASNAPGALWVLTGVEAVWIPHRTEPDTLERNAAFPEEMARLERELRSGGHIVWLDPYDYRTYLPTERQVARSLDLVLVEQFVDGAIYRAAR